MVSFAAENRDEERSNAAAGGGAGGLGRAKSLKRKPVPALGSSDEPFDLGSLTGERSEHSSPAPLLHRVLPDVESVQCGNGI